MAETHKDYEHRVPITEAERIAVAAAKLATNDTLNELMALFGVSRGDIDSVEKFKRNLMFAGAFAYGLVAWLRTVFVKN
jgi:hypothetical protein